ncbi:MAG TPA: hypothetical protein VE377_04480 [Candidatus Dormibacteraeota bacterium]|nr:hypothetical protein [Candidatus Dormibacteraeota bacterium]
MSNDRYLIVSYFVFAVVCLGMGFVAYRILRRPFQAIAETIAGNRSAILKRALAISMTVAAALGFLGYSYNQKGCVSYEQVVKNRDFLIDANVRQVQGAADWIALTVLAWGVVVVSGLSALPKRKAGE